MSSINIFEKETSWNESKTTMSVKNRCHRKCSKTKELQSFYEKKFLKIKKIMLHVQSFMDEKSFMLPYFFIGNSMFQTKLCMDLDHFWASSLPQFGLMLLDKSHC